MRAPGQLRSAAAWVQRAARSELVAMWRARPVDAHTVLYRSADGHRLDGAPEALFRALQAAPDLAHLRHVWALRDPDAYAGALATSGAQDRVCAVRIGTVAHSRALTTSRYIITDGLVGDDFLKREDQVLVDTGRGTPLVRLGYDVPGGGQSVAARLRVLLCADFLLSPSDFVTEAVYGRALRLRGIFRGRVIQEGDPRTDRAQLGPGERGTVLAALRDAGVEPAGRRILLYAPAVGTAEAQAAQCAELSAAVGDGWTVLLAPPPRVARAVAVAARPGTALLPPVVPVDLAIGVADAFATDQDERAYDALAAGRPVVLHRPGPDPKAGFYPGAPGPVTRTAADLAAALAAVTPPDPAIVHTYAPKADGRAAERVVDVVFRGRTEGYDVRDISRHVNAERRSVLVYLGSLRSNGITSSALNLLASMDHDRYDVTALYQAPADPDAANNADLIHPAVRLLPRSGGLVENKAAYLVRRRFLADPQPRERVPSVVEATLRGEWRRCLGGARFDHVVDFTGYSPFFSNLLALAPRDRGPVVTAIWLHNDMKADRAREVDGRRHLEEGLGAVAASYPRFDRLVSVSAALRAVNARNLADLAPPEAFTYAHNTIDHARIRRMAAEPPAVPPPAGAPTFVTVGRLSTEKNHDRLVRAFARLHAGKLVARLVVIGDGPLREHLRGLVAGLGVEHAVTLTGAMANPYPVMAAADCFVLSSDHEGQPMVILEARVLGLPVVATEFSSVAGSVTPADGLVVPRSVEGVLAGLQAMVDGKVPNRRFDAAAYNAAAVAEFYSAIGAG